MRNRYTKLLVVDDMAVNRLLLKKLFADDFEILEAENGQEALDILTDQSHEIAVILLDLVMPGVNGFDVLTAMNESGLIASIPVIVITGESAEEKALTSYSLGVSDLIVKPFNANIVKRRVLNVIDLYAHKNYLEQELQAQKEMLVAQDKRLKKTTSFLVDALATTIEFRSMETGEHIQRIGALTAVLLDIIKDEHPLPEEEVEIIVNASALHDIGKIAIPDSVLLKPGRLSQDEFEVMKAHTTKGCAILDGIANIDDQHFFDYCYDICRFHHERWDGGGYPDGLKGNTIPIWAQAVSLADVYDALTNDRVYKSAFTHEEAVEMILDGQCGRFNPLLTERFRQIESKLSELVAAYSQTDNLE